MAIFTVHVPNDRDDAFSRAERTAFVRDGFSVAAFVFGPLYLLRFGAWLAALAWVVVVAGGGWLCHLARLPGGVGVGLYLLVALLTGLEASSLRRFALGRRGYDLADVVEGSSRQDGERTFFRRAVLEGLPASRTVAGSAAPRPNEPVIGFFPDPDRGP